MKLFKILQGFGLWSKPGTDFKGHATKTNKGSPLGDYWSKSMHRWYYQYCNGEPRQLSFDWSERNFESGKQIYYFRSGVLWPGRFDWPKNVDLNQVLIENFDFEPTLLKIHLFKYLCIFFQALKQENDEN